MGLFQEALFRMRDSPLILLAFACRQVLVVVPAGIVGEDRVRVVFGAFGVQEVEAGVAYELAAVQGVLELCVKNQVIDIILIV